MYTIYALIDPRTDEVRYIGITDDVYTRFRQHVRCLEGNIDKNAWIQELRAANIMLIMKTIEVVDTFGQAREREDHWIHHYLSQGVRLLNQQITRSFTFEDFQKVIHGGRSEDVEIMQPASDLPVHIRKRQQYMTYEEASVYTGYSVSELHSLVRRGKIRASMPSGRKLLISSLRMKRESRR